MMSNNDAVIFIEELLDVLGEVGNGVTDKMLHEACDDLFRFRDEWLTPTIKKLQNNP